jgi:V/A-type H+-transporting ATPase subunit C
MTDGLLFANAVAKSKENTLFSEERLMRLIEAATLADAVKVLAEANYGGGTVTDDPLDFETVLKAEQRLLDDFLAGLRLEGTGIECFALTSDYHNVKAILKNLYGGGELSLMLEGGGRMDAQWLKERLTADSPDINPYIDAAVKEIRKAFEVRRSPRLIDTLIDKAMFADIAERLSKKGTDAGIRKFFVCLADLTNVNAMLRSYAIGANFAFFEASFAAGGKIPLSAFEKAYPDAEDKLTEFLKGTDYASFAARYQDAGLAGLDAAKDNTLLEIFKKEKGDMFTAAPVAGYYFAKKNEIKMLRIALVCIKNGVSRAEIRKRMRTMYA